MGRGSGAEGRGGKRRKKDRDLDELKKEVALVRETGCRPPPPAPAPPPVANAPASERASRRLLIDFAGRRSRLTLARPRPAP
ncbi:hypothetical protein CRUP_036696 [Coryphaenoides rupestris]|nr:hypothetical protein CRUP_036696 [Coryphaenoides rupestris]